MVYIGFDLIFAGFGMSGNCEKEDIM